MDELPPAEWIGGRRLPPPLETAASERREALEFVEKQDFRGRRFAGSQRAARCRGRALSARWMARRSWPSMPRSSSIGLSQQFGELNAALRPTDTVVTAIGLYQIWSDQFQKTFRPRHYLCCG
jgi:glyoxylate carboligase